MGWSRLNVYDATILKDKDLINGKKKFCRFWKFWSNKKSFWRIWMTLAWPNPFFKYLRPCLGRYPYFKNHWSMGITSIDREQINRQWFCHWFRRSDFVTKWGFGQDGSGDSRNIFRIALLSQSALFAVSLFAVSWFAVSLSRSVVVEPDLWWRSKSKMKKQFCV